MKKAKSNSVLDALPPNQQEALARWLFEENISYTDARARLLADFCVRSSEYALGKWYEKRAQERMLARIAQSSQKANAVVSVMQKNPAQTYDALIGLVSQAAFESAMDGEKLNVETLSDLTNLVLGAQSLKIKAGKLQLDRETFQRDTCGLFLKWSANERAKDIVNSAGTNAEKIEQLGALMFGEDWK